MNMEGISSDLACTGKQLLGNEIVSCNAAPVSSIDVNSGSVSDFQELKSLISNNPNMLTNGAISENKYMNEMPSDYDDINKKKFENLSITHAAQSPLKVVSPTIFENAIQAVKNLFSPAKPHGLFSQGLTQPYNNQLETKGLPNGNIKISNEDFLHEMEQKPTHERKLSFSDKENNLYFNEEDLYNTILRRASDTHNNTNDSYTSTVSRMDESFKSTVTHFDELTQNEAELSKAGTAAGENTNAFDSSLNKTIDAIERSLNNTLRRNLSFSSVENGEMNTTLKGCNANNINKNNNVVNQNNQSNKVSAAGESDIPEILGSLASGVENDKCKDAELQENRVKSVEETLESVTEVIKAFRESEKNTESLQEVDNLFKDIILSSTPNKQTSSEEIKCLDNSFLDLVPTKETDLIEEEHEINRSKTYSCLLQEEGHDITRCKTYSCLVQDMSVSKDKENSDPDPKTNNSVLAPKISPDLEKNFSTSTIVISKSELLNKENQREERKVTLADGNEQVLVELDVVNGKKVALDGSRNSGALSDANDIKNGTLISIVSENTDLINKENVKGLALSEQKNISEKEPVGINNLLNSQSSKEVHPPVKKLSLKSDVLSVYSPNHDLLNLDILPRNLLPESENQITSEECLDHEIIIPLASQKSYTVLHNVNPNLNRPVVPDVINNTEAYKLNDIILGDRTFSDFNVIYNGDQSNNMICNAESNQPNDKLTHSFDSSMIDKTGSDVRGLGRNNTEINSNILEHNLSQTIKRDFVQNKDFKLNNLLLPLSRSRSVIEMESEKEISKSLRQAGSLGSLNTSVENAISKGFHEKIRKSVITTTKIQDNSVMAVGNTSETDASLLQAKKEQGKISRKEPEPSPEVKNTSNELKKETLVGSAEEKYLCGDGNSSKKGSYGKGMENIDGKECYNIEDKFKNLVLDSVVLENVLQNPVKTDTQNKDFNLSNVKIDSEGPQMNNATVELKKELNFAVVDTPFSEICKFNDSVTSRDEEFENSKNSINASGSDTDLTQLIQEQFTPNDIEKVFSVVDDIPELNLSKNIVLASQQFDKSFQEKFVSEIENSPNLSNCAIKDNNDLDFLDSIKGKPSGRDYSRESLYVKFDPLVQSQRSAELFDISEGDKENIANSPVVKNTNLSDQLVSITPLKQAISINSVSPLTPTSQNNETKLSTEKLNKLRELQNEISRLREFYSQREETNREKMNNYQNKITQLTERACILEGKLKESEEMEKCLVRKLNTQNDSINCFRNIVEEYSRCVSTLTDQIEKLRIDNERSLSILKEEKDYYMNHLQSTEQAFSDVHSKYEKCKKAVEIYKKNEETYKSTIEDLKERIEQYNEKVKGIKESTEKELNRFQDKMNEMKVNHYQEISRFKAQLRKTELKVQTVQEALEQKIKENQELAGICDELIEGKKSDS